MILGIDGAIIQRCCMLHFQISRSKISCNSSFIVYIRLALLLENYLELSDDTWHRCYQPPTKGVSLHVKISRSKVKVTYFNQT